MYGSAASGLSTRYNSDLDLTIDYYGDKLSLDVLRDVRTALEAYNKTNKSCPYIFTKMNPFIASFGATMEFTILSRTDKDVYFEADILVNKILEEQNT